MKTWFTVVLCLASVIALTLIFAGHAMFSPETPSDLPETVARVEPTSIELNPTEPMFLKSNYLGDGLLPIASPWDQLAYSFANPATEGVRILSLDRIPEESLEIGYIPRECLAP